MRENIRNNLKKGIERMENLDFNRIHRFRYDDLKILLDVNSGSVHVIDQPTWDFFDYLAVNPMETAFSLMMDQYGYAEAEAVLDEISNLMMAGQLFTDDRELQGFTPHTEPIVKAICLHMAHDCNLRCGYCFADSGAYHGQRSLMSLETGKKALDFLIKASKHRQHIEVDFFGGEPLMNWDVVKQLVEYARSVEKERGKNFRFTLTTNGMLIDDDVIEFANTEMSNVVLSLDGRKEIHDEFRGDYAGNGSYDKIVPKFKQLVESRGGQGYYMRGTFTHANPDFTKDVFHMADLGFTELSMEPVVSAADDPMAVVNNLSNFIFGLIRAIGMILLGFGIVQIGLSLKSHDPSQRANGFLTLAGGVIITFAKEILNMITG